MGRAGTLHNRERYLFRQKDMQATTQHNADVRIGTIKPVTKHTGHQGGLDNKKIGYENKLLKCDVAVRQ